MKKPNTHNIRDLSEALLKQFFSKWICNQLFNDYGLDFLVTIVEDEYISSYNFFVQLKGTKSLRVSKNSFVFDIEKKYLKEYKYQILPVFLIIFDVDSEKGYWINIQKYIYAQLSRVHPKWEDQEYIRIKIPKSNMLINLDKFKKEIIKDYRFTFRILENHKNEFLKEIFFSNYGLLLIPAFNYLYKREAAFGEIFFKKLEINRLKTLANSNVESLVQKILSNEEDLFVFIRAWNCLLEKTISFDIPYLKKLEKLGQKIGEIEKKYEFIKNFEDFLNYNEEELKKALKSEEIDEESYEEIINSDYFQYDGELDWSDNDEEEYEDLIIEFKYLLDIKDEDILRVLIEYFVNKAKTLLKYPNSLITFFLEEE